MYFDNNEPTTAERLEDKFSELNRCDEKIRIAETAKERKNELFGEIQELYDKLIEEAAQ